MTDLGRHFLELDPVGRERSIHRTRQHIRLKQSVLAGKLIVHAAGLLKLVWPEAVRAELEISSGAGEEPDIVTVLTLATATDGEIETRPDFEPEEPLMLEAQALLGEASALGAFIPALILDDPLQGVILPAESPD